VLRAARWWVVTFQIQKHLTAEILHEPDDCVAVGNRLLIYT
jgi:hypothetical protein